MQEVYQPKGQFKNAKTAFCIHNIAFQGRFWPESFKDMNLPSSAQAKLGFTDGYSKVFCAAHRFNTAWLPSGLTECAARGKG